MYGKCSQEKTKKDFQAQTPQTLEKDPRPEKKEKVKRPFPGKEVLGKVFSVSGWRACQPALSVPSRP